MFDKQISNDNNGKSSQENSKISEQEIKCVSKNQFQNSSWHRGHQLKNGEYTIEKKLRMGGFSDIYLAKNKKLQNVVIKKIRKEFQSEEFEKFEENFIKEAINLARCKHHYIVPYKDIFKTPEGWCLVMDYIEGEDLHIWVKDKGRLSEREALCYIRQIGEALKVVHNQGLLHRDVKPRNIIRRANGLEAVLIDLGISRNLQIEQHTPYLTEDFAPIEQHKKRYERGAYTDVYALAATLYYLLSGQAPTPSILRSEEPLIPLHKLNPKISNEVEQAIILGMQIHPKERPQTIEEWLDLLPSDKDTIKSPLSDGKQTERPSETELSVANSQNCPQNLPDIEHIKPTQPPIESSLSHGKQTEPSSETEPSVANNPNSPQTPANIEVLKPIHPSEKNTPKQKNKSKFSNLSAVLTSPFSFLIALAIISYLGTSWINTGFWLVLIVVFISVSFFIAKGRSIKQLFLLFISSVIPTLLIFLFVPTLRTSKLEAWELFNRILIPGLLTLLSSLLGWTVMSLLRHILDKEN
ncbi:MAG: protein kinase [Nostocaceae cyanobacterium]|nr:protein kinase [Nostocaceae cyanobacterium]